MLLGLAQLLGGPGDFVGQFAGNRRGIGIAVARSAAGDLGSLPEHLRSLSGRLGRFTRVALRELLAGLLHLLAGLLQRLPRLLRLATGLIEIQRFLRQTPRCVGELFRQRLGCLGQLLLPPLLGRPPLAGRFRKLRKLVCEGRLPLGQLPSLLGQLGRRRIGVCRLLRELLAALPGCFGRLAGGFSGRIQCTGLRLLTCLGRLSGEVGGLLCGLRIGA